MYKNKRDKTKRKISDAFITLYMEENIDKITIKEITELAEINRTTFYDHYIDVYDVLDQLEAELLTVIDQNIELLVSHLKHMSPDSFFTIILSIFQEHDIVLPVLLMRSNSGFGEDFVSLIKKRLLQHFEDMDDESKLILDYCTTYHFSAAISFICKWIEEGKKIPVGQMIGLLKNITERGVFTVINELVVTET